MNRRSFAPLAVFLFALTLALTGCGGGGGGGGSSDGTGTGTGSPITPADVSGLIVPTGYSSVGFPAPGTSLNLSTLPADKTVVHAAVNATSYGTYSTLSADKAAFVANLTPLPKEPPTPARNLAPGGDFHKYLRDVEKFLPPIGNARPNAAQPNAAQPGAARPNLQAAIGATTETFLVINSPSPISVKATLRTTRAMSNGGNLYIYLDDNAAWDGTTNAFFQKLATDWVNTIYDRDRTIFGEEPGETLNGLTLGKDISVLCSPQLSNLGYGNTLAGFFYSGDLYPKGTFQDGTSNERKMFYLNHDLAKFDEVVLGSTMAHEFQHMINFYQRKLNNLTEEDWINESLSGYAEHVCGYEVGTNNYSKALQVKDFLANCRFTTLGNWDSTNAYYGQGYLFGTWLGQKYGPSGSVKNLLSSSTSGKTAVASFAGKTFERVFAEWALALKVNDYTSGTKYGIQGLNLENTYSFTTATGQKSVRLTGPETFTYSTFPIRSGNLQVQPFACGFFEVGGGDGSSVVLSYSSNLSNLILTK